MAGMGVLAIGVEGVTEGHFWLFVIGYAIARAATWPLWLRGRIERPNHLTRALPFAPFLLATLAVGFVHQVWLLVVALVVLATAEIGFSFAGRGDVEGRRLHGPHMVERIGLLLMLLLGECVVQIVNALDEDHREPMHWVTAACAMALSCALWWLVYDATVPRSRPRWIATTPRSPTSSAAPSSASPPGSSSWRPAWPTPSTRRRPRKARRTCTPDRSPACAPSCSTCPWPSSGSSVTPGCRGSSSWHFSPTSSPTSFCRPWARSASRRSSNRVALRSGWARRPSARQSRASATASSAEHEPRVCPSSAEPAEQPVRRTRVRSVGRRVLRGVVTTFLVVTVLSLTFNALTTPPKRLDAPTGADVDVQLRDGRTISVH
ncbi:hypothetical protein D1832_12400 [Dermacoccus abyssi]|uniref:Low temperature requirement protein A n=1 Tax=Dermacoccus abyssi TaxID=322596 RepID=A0A417Z1P2_9MICO|nr:hypothetical protein D1832_12400 [Dermacoccus abyssi]